jgi:hypothetical protein
MRQEIEYQAKLRDILVEKILPKFVDGYFGHRSIRLFNETTFQAAQVRVEIEC